MMSTSKEWNRISERERSVIRSLQNGGKVPVGRIAEALGLKVKVTNLGPGISGMIQRDQGTYVIKINRFEAKERQRFTVAHELAHYLLHREIIDSSPDGIKDNVLYRSGAPETVEYEANRLAADILMPDSVIEEKLSEFGGRFSEGVIEALADYFRVSKAAMEIRLGGVAA